MAPGQCVCAPKRVLPSSDEVAREASTEATGERDIFSLFAEVERDLISERTREGLAKARASGRKLGRPKGSLSVEHTDYAPVGLTYVLELACRRPEPSVATLRLDLP